MTRHLEPGLHTDLTELQERVLDYIDSCVNAGLPPTRAEIARYFGWKSVNAADTHLRFLERKGRIVLLPGISRGIKLVPPARMPSSSASHAQE